MQKRAHLIVHGRVQGVGFRAYTHETATRLGLSGFVRNRSDGTVEIVAEGSPESLNKLIAWANIGPSMARVDHVETTWGDATGEWGDFRVVY